MTKKRKLLPTSARCYVPPEFMDAFIEHGHQKPERTYGKSSCDKYRKVIGRKRLKAAHDRYKEDKKRDPTVDVVPYRIAMKRQRQERET